MRDKAWQALKERGQEVDDLIEVEKDVRAMRALRLEKTTILAAAAIVETIVNTRN